MDIYLNYKMVLENYSFIYHSHRIISYFFPSGKSYLLHKSRQDQLVLVNSKYISSGWRKVKENEEASTLKSLGSFAVKSNVSSVGEFIQEDGKNLPPPDMNKSSIVYMNSAASDLGSSLGYCLANINK